MNDVREVSLQEYVSILQRRWKLIAVVPLLLGLLGFFWSNSKTRLYSVGAEVLVESQSATNLVDPTGFQVAADQERQLENEIRFANSSSVYNSLLENLGYEPDLVAVSADAESADVLQFVSTNADPATAAEEANVFARTFLRARAQRVVQTYQEANQGIDELLVRKRADLAKLDKDNPEDASAIADLDADIRYYQGQRDALDLTAQVGRGSGASVISEAEVPLEPVSPRPLRTAALAIAAGLVLGVGLAFVREFLDDTIRTPDDLSRLTPAPVLGQIPRDDRSGTLDPSHEPEHSGLDEAFRSLRTSVQFAAIRSPLRAIQVTSANPSDGKTTVAAHLAVSLARAGEQVVLIDADFRNPSLNGRFGLGNDTGLSNVLLGQVPLDAALVTVDPALPLQFLPSGPQPGNPADFLWSATAPDGALTLPKLIAQLTAAGRQVVIDCPPVLPVADAMTISRMVDGTLFVVASDETGTRDVSHALERLGQAEANLVGVVLNQVEMSAGGYGYGYGYGYGAARPRTWHQRLLARFGLWKPKAGDRRATIAVPTKGGSAGQLPPIERPAANAPKPPPVVKDDIVDLVDLPAPAPTDVRPSPLRPVSSVVPNGRSEAPSRIPPPPPLTERTNGGSAVVDADAVLIKRLRDHLGVGDGAA